MTLQEFVKAHPPEPWIRYNSEEEANFWLRAFVLLIRAEAADLPPEADLGYGERICRVFDKKCEEFGLPVDTNVEVVRIINCIANSNPGLKEPEP